MSFRHGSVWESIGLCSLDGILIGVEVFVGNT